MLTSIINEICNSLAAWGNIYLFPIMIVMFFAAIVVKSLVQHLLTSLLHFISEFEKRVHRHVEGEYPQLDNTTDYVKITEELMKKTIHELYEMRVKNLRRKLDRVASFTDRLFMVEEGARRIMSDTTKEIRYFKYEKEPNFSSSVKFILGINPYFHRLFGFIPLKSIGGIMAILPGLFIIGGIFGTFLGITSGIPKLKYIDPANVQAAKSIMGFFLDNMAFSMNTSVVGIFFSVIFTLINTLYSPRSSYQESVHKMLHSLELLWKDVTMKQKLKGNASTDKDHDNFHIAKINGNGLTPKSSAPINHEKK
jgi:hypothetical protein